MENIPCVICHVSWQVGVVKKTSCVLLTFRVPRKGPYSCVDVSRLQEIQGATISEIPTGVLGISRTLEKKVAAQLLKEFGNTILHSLKSGAAVRS